jgi:hypothetical protein
MITLPISPQGQITLLANILQINTWKNNKKINPALQLCEPVDLNKK